MKRYILLIGLLLLVYVLFAHYTLWQTTWEWNRTTHTIVLIILIAPWVIALGFALWRNYRRHGLMHTLRRIVKGISIGP